MEALADLAAAAVTELEPAALSPEHRAERLRRQLAVVASGVGGFDGNLRSAELSRDAQVLALSDCSEDDFEVSVEAFKARAHQEELRRVSRALSETTEMCGCCAVRITHSGAVSRTSHVEGTCHRRGRQHALGRLAPVEHEAPRRAACTA